MQAEAENQRGVEWCRQGQWEEAIGCFRQALELDPSLFAAHCNLGVVLLQQGQLPEAAQCFRAVLTLDPTFAQAHQNLGTVLSRQQKWEEAMACFQAALQFNPSLAEAHYNLGVAWTHQQQWDQATLCFEAALQLRPHLVEAHFDLGKLKMQQGQWEEAIGCFEQTLQLRPHFPEAYVNLCIALYRIGNLPAMLEVAQIYREVCGEADGLRADLYGMWAAYHQGLYEVAQEMLQDLEIRVEALGPSLDEPTTRSILAALYPELLFHLPYLRDDVVANARLAQRVAQCYFEERPQPIPRPISPVPSFPQESLRIGILSKYFCRVSEGWCSRDLLRELALLNPDLYLYGTARFKPDDLTEEFKTIARRFFLPPSLEDQVYLKEEREVLEAIWEDDLDVLIDIDSVMTRVHPAILHHSPARICVSWLGFEPPIVSRHHYFLGDPYLHPPGVEQHYYERLIRLPDSFLAIGGLSSNPIDVKVARQVLGIGGNQVAYLCMATSLKFSATLARSHVQILRAVPNSVLLHKGSGDTDKAQAGRSVIQETYRWECEQQGVAFDRICFLGRTPTEEEHRTIYQIADVLLDSYPFNGVTHSLEALWFELPIVTLVGQQLYARASYSFLQNLGVSAGIAHSWEEYIEWAIRLGQNRELRQEIRSHLQDVKQPDRLAPLWNPRKFAADLLGTLRELAWGKAEGRGLREASPEKD
ncbi:MAG: tetratricopeptide repeat protein [Leptolyngbyaceae cyanobacterium bins.59]|nr:tetratricopeptide repeat protein [Leptolyngbyaceae cyanobacterium bins.59]